MYNYQKNEKRGSVMKKRIIWLNLSAILLVLSLNNCSEETGNNAAVPGGNFSTIEVLNITDGSTINTGFIMGRLKYNNDMEEYI